MLASSNRCLQQCNERGCSCGRRPRHHAPCLLLALAHAFQSSPFTSQSDTAQTSGRFHSPKLPAVCAVAAADPEVGRARRRPRRFLGFTWTEFKLLSCVVAVMCLAINGGVCSVVRSEHPCDTVMSTK
jgi:hypothetical protein